MADQQQFTSDVNLVAIDIAKEWNVALVEDTTGKRRSFKFANWPADYQAFVQFLHALPGLVRVLKFGLSGSRLSNKLFVVCFQLKFLQRLGLLYDLAP